MGIQKEQWQGKVSGRRVKGVLELACQTMLSSMMLAPSNMSASGGGDKQHSLSIRGSEEARVAVETNRESRNQYSFRESKCADTE